MWSCFIFYSSPRKMFSLFPERSFWYTTRKKYFKVNKICPRVFLIDINVILGAKLSRICYFLQNKPKGPQRFCQNQRQTDSDFCEKELKVNRNTIKYNSASILKSTILGNPGATSRDGAIFSGERYFRAKVYLSNYLNSLICVTSESLIKREQTKPSGMFNPVIT